MNADSRKARVALLSVGSNSLLVVLKLITGVAIGSVSVVSEAIHSAIDLLAALIALFAVRTSAKPADESHPFGHGKVENLSGTIEALLIFVAAVWIGWEAVDKFLHPRSMEHAGWGTAVMLFSCVVNAVVSHALFRVGKATDSIALKADAWHLLTDVWTSAGVMVALGVMWVANFYGMKLGWLDPVAALFVAVLITSAAYKLTRQAGHDLMDGGLPEDEIAWIREYLARRTPPLRAYHQMRTRKAGSVRFIEFHILVDPGMSVDKSHSLAGEIKHAIVEHFDGVIVTIHVEPAKRAKG